MKTFVALAAVAIAAVTLYATAAPAGQQAVTPAQFNALKKQVTKIRADLNAVTTVLAGCVMGQAVPITRYNGYVAADQNGSATSRGSSPGVKIESRASRSP